MAKKSKKDKKYKKTVQVKLPEQPVKQRKHVQDAPRVADASPPVVFKGAIVALLAFTALLYIRSLFNDLASWDDNEYILFNHMLRNFSLDGIWEIFSTF